MYRSPYQGFTLIELMIAIAILGILSALAIPSYQASILRTHRSEAKSALLNAAAAFEQYYAQYNTYVGAPPTQGMSATTYYSFATSAVTTSTYTITATAAPSQSQAQDTGCTVLTTDQTGNQTPAACWN